MVLTGPCIILDISSMLAREAPTSVSASIAIINTTSKILYNDQAKAIVALEQKNLTGPCEMECTFQIFEVVAVDSALESEGFMGIFENSWNGFCNFYACRRRFHVL